ncbi:hypothetical protein QJS10_CPA05g00385 [Acorus calamus]|uniref:Uncharacterized protein n=1 Tax=Acorus calamus TaxID=4465 RepID=A0AAV9EVL0_ACOCL|nr:hypothetical protein QJS10_CPA05g00385 [Acorus calamus]
MFSVDDNPDGSRVCHEPKYHKVLGNTKGLVGTAKQEQKAKFGAIDHPFIQQ